MTKQSFVKIVYRYYAEHGRHDLPWRAPALVLRKDGTLDPYKILVSEMMLQQTQVGRVIPKYKAFLKRFPGIRDLAEAPLSEVLSLWSGLGYNRRARFLKRAAEQIAATKKFPVEKDELKKLPGVGEYTAGAIRAFALNAPDVFLETNIRSAIIHHFFDSAKKVSDKKLISLVENMLDRKNPRQWYSALMDYGAHIKTTVANPSRRSIQYKRQAPFEGSLRQKRGKVLKYMVKNGFLTAKTLSFIVPDETQRHAAIAGLLKDNLIRKMRAGYTLA